MNMTSSRIWELTSKSGEMGLGGDVAVADGAEGRHGEVQGSGAVQWFGEAGRVQS